MPYPQNHVLKLSEPRVAQWRRRQTGALMFRGSSHNNSTNSGNGYEQATNLKLLVVSHYVIFFHLFIVDTSYVLYYVTLIFNCNSLCVGPFSASRWSHTNCHLPLSFICFVKISILAFSYVYI